MTYDAYYVHLKEKHVSNIIILEIIYYHGLKNRDRKMPFKKIAFSGLLWSLCTRAPSGVQMQQHFPNKKPTAKHQIMQGLLSTNPAALLTCSVNDSIL